MSKKPISEELKLEFEEIRASMAIEGYDISDATMARAIEEYLSDPDVKKIPDIKAKAEREGRSFFAIACEELGLKAACGEDDE